MRSKQRPDTRYFRHVHMMLLKDEDCSVFAQLGTPSPPSRFTDAGPGNPIVVHFNRSPDQPLASSAWLLSVL